MGAAPTAGLEDGAAPVCGMAARGLNDLSCKSCSLRGRRDDEATDVSSMSAHTVLQAGHSARAHDLPVIADGNEGYGTSALLLSHSILDHRGRLLEGGPAEAVPLKVASIPFAYGPNEHVVTVVREVSRVQLVASSTPSANGRGSASRREQNGTPPPTSTRSPTLYRPMGVAGGGVATSHAPVWSRCATMRQ